MYISGMGSQTRAFGAHARHEVRIRVPSAVPECALRPNRFRSRYIFLRPTSDVEAGRGERVVKRGTASRCRSERQDELLLTDMTSLAPMQDRVVTLLIGTAAELGGETPPGGAAGERGGLPRHEATAALARPRRRTLRRSRTSGLSAATCRCSGWSSDPQ